MSFSMVICLIVVIVNLSLVTPFTPTRQAFRHHQQLFMSYGPSAGYIKSKQAASHDSISKTVNTHVTQHQPIVNEAKSTVVEEINTAVRKTYGFSSGYVRGSSSQHSNSDNDNTSTTTTPVTVTKVEIAVETPIVISQAPTPEVTNTAATVSVTIPESPLVEVAAVTKTIPIPVLLETIVDATPEDEFSFQFLSDLNYEQQLKKTAVNEIAQYSQTYANLENLKNTLSKSLSRKEEAENMIVQELNELRPMLIKELTMYENRSNELEKMLQFLKSAYTSKEKQIQREGELFQQMKDIRLKITEKRILTEYDIALNKKMELIAVDQNLFQILTEYITLVTEELKVTKIKRAFLQEKNKSYPQVDDRNAMLQYSWSDISDIQSVLLKAEELTETWKSADDSMRRLIDSLNNAEINRAAILDEVKVIENQQSMDVPVVPVPIEIAAAATSAPSSSSVGSVEDDLDSSRTSMTTTATSAASTSTSTPSIIPSSSSSYGIQKFDPLLYSTLSVTNGYSIVKLPSKEWTSFIEEKSSSELAFIFGNVLLLSLSSFIQLSASLLESTFKFTGSEEAAESKKAVDLTLNAAGNVGKNIGNAVNTVQNTWTESMKDGKVEGTADEYIAKVIKASQRVVTSSQLKSTLSDISKNAVQSATEATTATSIATSSLTDNLKSSEKFKTAVAGLTASFKFLAVVSATAAAKVLNNKK